MNLDNFYSEPSLETWKIILGEKMHYHFSDDSNPNEDPFDQSIINIFPFIKPQSKILDCGCGWGGPARLIKEKLNCDVTGVTNSAQQYNYIKDFKIIYADLENFVPTEYYDTALFYESVTHIENFSELLFNIQKYVNNIIIVDYVVDHQTIYVPEWREFIRHKNDFINPIKNAGYKIEHFSQKEKFLQPAINYWLENFKKIDSDLISGHLKTLHNFCHTNKKNNYPGLGLCTIYATK
jgi:hypothetical protein